MLLSLAMCVKDRNKVHFYYTVEHTLNNLLVRTVWLYSFSYNELNQHYIWKGLLHQIRFFLDFKTSSRIPIWILAFHVLVFGVGWFFCFCSRHTPYSYANSTLLFCFEVLKLLFIHSKLTRVKWPYVLESLNIFQDV